VIYFLIVNYHSTALILRLINSLPVPEVTLYQVIIVNNSPEDQDIQKLRSKYVHIIEANSNLGFARACNLGLQFIYEQNSQAIVWLINPDAYLNQSNLEQVLSFFVKHPEISILGTTIYTPSGEIWFGGGRFIAKLGAIFTTNLLTSSSEQDYVESDWVSGCSLLLNLKNFTICPLFDANYFLYYEDFDFCHRYGNQGHQIVVNNQISVIHEPSSITDRNLTDKFKYSTYSYLLTLQKYSTKLVFFLRLLRLLFNTLIIFPFNSSASLGKLIGIVNFYTKNQHCTFSCDRDHTKSVMVKLQLK
jgi:GT2 family glycosyltransferase